MDKSLCTDANSYFMMKCNCLLGYVAWILFAIFSPLSAASPAEPGALLVQYFAAKDYKAGLINWAATQDHRGFMYFANGQGALEFDGDNWNLIPLDSGGQARSIATDDAGVVYVGGVGEFGYLAADPQGRTVYRSLSKNLTNDEKEFSNVWTIHATTHGVYFVAHKKIFRWHNAKLTVIYNGKFNRGSLVNDVVYLFHFHGGISKLTNGHITLIPNSEFLSVENAGRTNILPYSDTQLLIITASKGGYLYSHNDFSFKPFATEVDDYIKRNKLYYGAVVDDNGNYYLTTINGGIVVINRFGKLIRVINQNQVSEINGNSTIPMSSTSNLYLDNHANLWVTTSENGIFHISIRSPWTVYDASKQAKAVIIDAVRYKGRLYISSFGGIFYLPEYKLHNENDAHEFVRLNAPKQQSFGFLMYQGFLLAIVQDGLYWVEGDRAHKLLAVKGGSVIMSIGKSNALTDYVFIGKNSEGIDAVKLDTKEDEISASLIRLDIPGLDDKTVRTILGDQDGNVWVVTESHGIYRLNFSGDLNDYTLHHYGINEGLPVLNNNYLVLIENELILYNREGIYKTAPTLNNENDIRFTRDLKRGELFFNNGDKILGLAQYGKDLFVKTGTASGLLLKQNDGHYVWDPSLFSVVPNNGRSGTPSELVVYVEPDLTLWQPADITLYRLKPEQKKWEAKPFAIAIRSVVSNGSIPIFNGNFTKKVYPADYDGLTDLQAQQPAHDLVELPFEQNSIAFKFSAQDYDFRSKIEYSYQLEGFDKGWSAWSHDTKKEYTNLSEGHYQFAVKAKNTHGIQSAQAYYRFRVLPPWYRSIFAYLLYIVLLFVSIIPIVKFRTNRISRYAARLEEEAAKRTSHIKELLDKKNELFAHVSHELRTPLTLILGPVTQVLEMDKDRETVSKLAMVKRNTQRLLKMVDQLLMISKANVPGLIEKRQQNITAISRLVVTSVKPLAIEKNIEVCSNIEDGLYAEMISDAVETILLNLCVNAIKYTPNDGRVEISIAQKNNIIVIKVSDTGPGIPEEQQEKIFERFTRLARDQQGVGLGLALVKELINAHHGNIKVQSDIGIGSKFIVELPSMVSAKVVDSGRNIELKDDYALMLNIECDQKRENVSDTFSAIDGQDDDSIQILIVDDEPDMAQYLMSVLAGYRCAIKHNGDEGIHWAKNNVPDLIVSDLMMPGKDGLQLLEAIRKDVNTSHIPVIMLTAKGDDEYRVKAYRELADDYITKPFDTNELLVRIQSLLAVRDLVHQRFSSSMVSGRLASNNDAYNNLRVKDRDFLHRLEEVINSHYQETDFSAKDIKDYMNMSERPLQRKLKALLGLTPTNYLKIYRLEKAADYLRHEDLPIDEILELIGIQSRSHFYAYFKAYYGVTPKEYRNTGTFPSGAVKLGLE